MVVDGIHPPLRIKHHPIHALPQADERHGVVVVARHKNHQPFPEAELRHAGNLQNAAVRMRATEQPEGQLGLGVRAFQYVQ